MRAVLCRGGRWLAALGARRRGLRHGSCIHLGPRVDRIEFKAAPEDNRVAAQRQGRDRRLQPAR